MFDLPKPILYQLLSAYNTRKDTLTLSEQQLAERIALCSLCKYIWVRRKKALPDRCPSCHHRGWDRPLINAMLGHPGTVTDSMPIPQPALNPAPKGEPQ